MRPRQETTVPQKLVPRSFPWGKLYSAVTADGGELYSALTSEFGEVFTVGKTPTTQSAEMVTTLPAPAYTTVWRTSLVTVHLTDTKESRSTQSSEPSATSDPSPTIATTKKHTTIPVIRSETPSGSPTPTLSFATHNPIATPAATETQSASTSSSKQRQAIIGGLSGAIAGLVIIGLLICFLVRRRRRSRDDEPEALEVSNEKGVRPPTARHWSQLTSNRSPEMPVTRSSTPDLDMGPLRVSLDNWPRPFAQGESFRDSIGPRRLQVMNPGPSRPTTGRRSSESASHFLTRQRSALAAVFINRSRQNSSSRLETSSRSEVPTIAIDPALSNEWVAPNAPTPSCRSYRSYSSRSSLPVVEQQPPEDPFLTPPDERDEMQSPRARPLRPTITPLQSAAGAAGRTLSHLGSALNPFRPRMPAAESVTTTSRHSVSTFSSAGDPFKLDRPSIWEANRTVEAPERAITPARNPYEGT